MKNRTCRVNMDENYVIGWRVYALDKTGVIPEVLTSFKYLTFLKIDQNYFTGPLPAFIGNLTALKGLSIAHNAFSGTIPKELGNLKELTSLSFGVNNFSGTLPPELGNLVKLEELYINSCGVGGEIPSTFANLKGMRVLWASDDPFTGNIPDFIGNWTGLTSLRFQGNSFVGPIPSSFSNLTSLNSLRISDLSNVSSTLDFIKNLKKLTDLTLRNALINGSIPSDIGEITTLNILDLSFNNLTGQVPSALFNLSSLEYLFLGNNSLSGTLPNQKSDRLRNIDLSYNYLSGTFPSWVASNLQLNFVANNFSFDSSNISVLPGLNCLQRNFPCNRNTPRYANVSIKCGGPEKRTADGTLYEAENSSISAASFTVTSTEKWGLSNVGLFSDRQNTSYVENTLTQVTGTNTPELYQTSRISPSSLRYYGLGLQNGPYTIDLLFAETAFADRSSRTWKSLGRRVFDIYIQGNRRLKDFDISREAGGINKAITMTFNVTVSENHLEIHLFWAGKGTCCTPVQGYYGPIISALNVVPGFTPTVSGIAPSIRKEKSRTGLIVGISVSAGVVILILLFAVLYISRKRDSEDEEVFLGMGPRPNTFSYAQLRTATEDFSPSKKLGEGGFGPVYKAWNLHESSQSLALMDPRVMIFDENEALRVIGVALLCTQASPAMRPTMSRVIAMLTGDIEVTAVASKPSYLTDWHFKDITASFSTENARASTESEASKNKNKSEHQNSIDLSPQGDQIYSPVNITEPRLSELIGDGRYKRSPSSIYLNIFRSGLEHVNMDEVDYDDGDDFFSAGALSA
ncbi:unnamed protein product [Dovyalis caffra]|uniref:non-specific serine/threonine protein kinase n=1 Tax=Dovyalis caffra TaxID=77055 RepID=A0AAV1RGF8_9ROSI|nr:unnamed protein product [Dovyalis caffra]